MFWSLLEPNASLNQVTVKTNHSNLYFRTRSTRFLVNSVNAASHMTVWLMTDEVLTEGRAGWHAGRRRPWRLRGKPEIALLLHYGITSQLISPSWLLHQAIAKMSWDGNNWMQRLWVTQRKHSEIVQYLVYCIFRQTGKDDDDTSNKPFLPWL